MEFLNTAIMIVGAMVVIAYVYLYISSRQYLKEGYAAEIKMKPCTKKGAAAAPPPESNEVVIQQTDTPYTNAKIMNVDDYEYSMVFENESDREVSADLMNKLQSQYPMDWSTQPPSSSGFQQGVKEMFQNNKVVEPTGQNPYMDITDESLQPPDTGAMEAEERKLLQTYTPKKAGDLTTYDVDDAMALIRKIYGAKGEIPQVIKKDNNVYEVVGTRRKDEKIVYEETDDAAEASEDPSTESGENTINVPQAATDMNTSLDPFYESSGSTRNSKWNFRQWTPGLERMFAPTEPREKWY
jgi:hypothetical protein